MRYMNDHDINFARRRFTRASCPNRLALVLVIDQLRHWANGNSDGWAYWSAPCRAARKAIDHVYSTTNAANDEQERHDITDAEMRAAVRPIKAFLTRHKHMLGSADREMILRAVEAPTSPFEVVGQAVVSW